jgi:hypothetical protein
LLIGWQMANTFIELNDTPSDFIGQGLKFLRVNADANAVVFGPVEINDLTDVQANLAYAPQSGQALIYSSAAGKWRPGTVDVYSAGNGISKSALTLNVVAGTSGGLTSNTNGVYITDIANVSGTWGNASYVPRLTINSKGQITGVTPTLITATQAVTITSPFVGNVNGTSGQIRVTGGTGNNSNAVIDLVATGVTAATYGNTTHLPRITVDTYGRIQNVDLIEILGSNGGGTGTTLGFGNIIVAGQTTVSADQAADDVTFVAGTGISITTQANADRITFSTNASAIASSINLADLNDVNATGIVNGQVLIWNSSTSMFEAGNMSGAGGSNVDLTDFSVITAAPSGNGSLVYNNAGAFTFTPANVQASGSTQSLSWNSSTYSLSISGGNSVDLSVLKDNTDAQTLSLSGNVITVSGSNSSVNLTSILNSVAGNYSNSNVAAYLTANSYATQTYVNTANTNMKAYVDAGLANAAGNYGNSNVASYLTVNNYATQSYVTTQINNLTAGAPAALDTLAEIANALNNSNSTLATVAFTGNHSSLANRPSMSLASNTYLLYDGSNVNLSNVIGQQGIQGNTGPQGVSVSSASISGSNLLLTLSNAATIDAGNVRGPQGIQGLQGDGNAGIANATVAGNNNLIIGLINGTYINAGNVKGPQGDQGNAGVGITSVSLVSSNLVLNYSNTSTQDVGNIRGPQGNAGTNGVSISTAAVNGSGNLILTLSNASTVDAGNVRGADGTGDITGVTAGTGLSGGGASGAVTLSLGTSGVTAGTYGNATTMPQFTVDTYGRITGVSNIAISAGGGSGDIEGVTAGNGLIDGGTTGTVTLNVGAGTGITVNADNIALTSGVVSTGAKTYGSATLIPQITVDTYGRVTNVSNVSVSGGGGGGGATIQRFKLNYSTTGTLANTDNLSSGISSVTIDSASGGECTINFTGYYYPPGSIMLYGYDRTNNKYLISHLETTMGQREVPGGGTAGSPTAFDGATSETVVKLKLREAETGASRAFGTTTHAWIQFVMYD